MQFPVDMTFRMLGWYAQIHLTDASGRMIGYIPFPKPRRDELPIYADQSMGAPIYTIRAEHILAEWFEDAAGRRIGGFAVTPTTDRKLVIVDGEPRFRLEHESEWLRFIDSLVPSLPLLNGLTGPFVRPSTKAVRTQDGKSVLRIVKTRMMIDIRYTLDVLEELSGAERECLMLTAIIYAMVDHRFRTMS